MHADQEQERSTLNHVNATHADGVLVAAWLAENERIDGASPRVRTALRRWRRGWTPTYAGVDITFGRHPSELPDDVWVAPAPNRSA